jgi:hypothetical protein
MNPAQCANLKRKVTPMSSGKLSAVQATPANRILLSLHRSRLKLKNLTRNISLGLRRRWQWLVDISTAKGRMRLRLLKETNAINDARIEKFSQYEAQRVKAHGNTRVMSAITQDNSGIVHWANRKARRKAKLK